jgi:hypothetical protein
MFLGGIPSCMSCQIQHFVMEENESTSSAILCRNRGEAFAIASFRSSSDNLLAFIVPP